MSKFFSCSLASGSKGNCIYIESESTEHKRKFRILADAGLSMKTIISVLGNNEMNTSPEEVDAIFITHEHGDHIKGLKTICKNFNKIPVYMNEFSYNALDKETQNAIRNSVVFYEINNPVTFGKTEVTGFRTPHDSAYSMGFTVSEYGEKVIGIATDIGCISKDVYVSLMGCETVYIESNHDICKLRTGKYPYFLKKRILSEVGHLSNEDCSSLLPYLVRSGTKNIILYHLSGENNTHDLAYTASVHSLVRAGFKRGDVFLQVAPPDKISVPINQTNQGCSVKQSNKLNKLNITGDQITFKISEL